MSQDLHAIKQLLVDGGSHIFSLNYADPVFEGFYRIRVERVRLVRLPSRRIWSSRLG